MANVLIVDDDADTVEATAELLESNGHKIQTGYNGEQGLKSLGAGSLPDCVVLDVDMPVLSGPGMAHRMLLHDAGQEMIPILLVSGRNDLSEIARCIGTPYFLAKASDDYGEALLRILEQALRERQAPSDCLEVDGIGGGLKGRARSPALW
jgi:CheY-like chemotaxis protein